MRPSARGYSCARTTAARAGTRRRHDFDQRDQLGRVQRVRHEAAILAAAAREDLSGRRPLEEAGEQACRDRSPARSSRTASASRSRPRESPRSPSRVLDGLEQAPRLRELEQAALHDALGGALQRHQGTGTARHSAAARSRPCALASNTVTGQPAEAHSAAQPQPMSPHRSRRLCGASSSHARLLGHDRRRRLVHRPAEHALRQEGTHRCHVHLRGHVHPRAVRIDPRVPRCAPSSRSTTSRCSSSRGPRA